MKMFTGDLKPDLSVTLSSLDGVDLDEALGVRIIGRRSGLKVFDRLPSTTTVNGGVSTVTMEWVTGDTDVAGPIEVEVEVTWPGDKKQTFRVPRSEAVVIYSDFDL